MRILTAHLAAGLLAAGLVASPGLHAATKHAKASKAVAVGAPACEFEADRTAFDIEGLKSQLMLTALACKKQDQYNAFMSRYKPAVASAEAGLASYFKRSYGRQGQTQYDAYITNLADEQEKDGLKSGTAYCDNLNVMFDEVMSLHNASELHDFTNAKVIVQPITFETCTGAPPASTRTKARHVSAKTKHA
jgi:hypothetical protein